jgi:hypothetical protein
MLRTFFFAALCLASHATAAAVNTTSSSRDLQSAFTPVRINCGGPAYNDSLGKYGIVPSLCGHLLLLDARSDLFPPPHSNVD